ncbi:MAG: HAMP domain-containing protein [Polyangia bacterium]
MERYLQSAHASGPEAERKPALLKAAYDEIDRLVNFSVVNARRARMQATHWESLATGVAVTIGIGVVLFSGWLLWWLRSRAVRPVLDLATSIERFAHGHHEARAAEAGPGELRDMARRFNQMADALAPPAADAAQVPGRRRA